MFNAYIMKKWVAFIMAGILPVLGFFIGLTFYEFWIGMLLAAVCMLFGVLIGFLVLRNPFTDMLEGKGILVIDLSSTGILFPFIVRLNNPDILGRLRKKKIKEVFDRETVFTFNAPVKAQERADLSKDGVLTIRLNREEFNKSRLAFMQYPCLIYNSHIESLITKDWLSEKEKSAFAEHLILLVNRNVQELSSHIRDFARYVVEQLKPKGVMTSKWVWIIIIVFVVIMIAIFLPSIISTIGGSAQSASDTLTNTNIIRPA